MLKLRMQRAGKTHRPFYKIVAAHSTKPRNGAFVEKIGTYNSIVTPPQLNVDEAKAIKWLQRGAQPSDTVKSLFRKVGILHKWRLTAKGLTTEQIQAEMEKWQANQVKKAAEKRIKKTKAVKKKTQPQQEGSTAAASE
ncbi:30S ribosomal protein S16 [bacterium]|nr:30S ribosomal protein S16 [bacterium]